MQVKGGEVLVVRMEPARKRRDDPQILGFNGIHFNHFNHFLLVIICQYGVFSISANNIAAALLPSR